MTPHREIRFEDEICADLAAAGWLHAEDDAATYDRVRALFPNCASSGVHDVKDITYVLARLPSACGRSAAVAAGGRVLTYSR